MQYTVQSGDTLFAISRRFGVDMQDLLGSNRWIHDPNDLKVGRVIELPGRFARSAAECPVPEPQIARFVPAGATVKERIVRLTGGRVPERVFAFRVEGIRAFNGIVVLQFTCAQGWQEVYSRLDIRRPLEFLAFGPLLGNEREQVVIGELSNVYAVRSFMVLGTHGGRTSVLLDQRDVELPPGTFRIRNGHLLVGPLTQGIRYSWNGTGFIRTRY